MKSRLTILLLTFITSTFSFGQLKLADLNIDTTITGFHFAVDFQGTNIFTKNGSSDLQTINPTAFSFTLAPNMTEEVAKGQIEMLLNMSVRNGYKISDITKKDTTLKGYNAYYISYIETLAEESYKNFVFNAFVIKEKTLILFTSGDLDNGIYSDKIRRTFYSIKL